MEFSALVEYLNKKFKDRFELKDEKSIIYINPDAWLELATFIKNDKMLHFNYLMCISSYDLGDEINYGVAYNFYSSIEKHYLEVRIEVNDELQIPSVSKLWRTADWHEREAYDMMGIKFAGHPNMKRILLSDDWDGHPLRKHYKEPDYYHGMPVPKDKSYWD